MITGEPLNIVMLMLVVVASGGCGCLWQSPDALEGVARKLRARARATRIARKEYAIEWENSLREDEQQDRERRELDLLVRQELVKAMERQDAE